MLSVLRSRLLCSVIRCNITRQFHKNVAVSSMLFTTQKEDLFLNPYQINLQNTRLKSKKKKAQGAQQDESGSDDEESKDKESDVMDKHTKVMSVTVNSLRLDLILKSGLGMARNKVETLFYESKIRLNGQKVLKKSEHVSVGDEIDVIKGPSPNNPNFLVVARVEVISVAEKGDALNVKLRRFKSIAIENYEENSKPGS